jgi:hypothetical protein
MDEGMYWWEVWGKEPGDTEVRKQWVMPDLLDWAITSPEQDADKEIERLKGLGYTILEKKRVFIVPHKGKS